MLKMFVKKLIIFFSHLQCGCNLQSKENKVFQKYVIIVSIVCAYWELKSFWWEPLFCLIEIYNSGTYDQIISQLGREEVTFALRKKDKRKERKQEKE